MLLLSIRMTELSSINERTRIAGEESRNELKIRTQIRNPSCGGNCFNYTIYIKRQSKKEQD